MCEALAGLDRKRLSNEPTLTTSNLLINGAHQREESVWSFKLVPGSKNEEVVCKRRLLIGNGRGHVPPVVRRSPPPELQTWGAYRQANFQFSTPILL